MARTVFWVFLLAGLFSPMVNGQFTDTTDDSFDDNDDDDENAGEDADTNDYGDVFNDYFDDEMRVVDVDQDVAIRACVNNADALVNKIDSAYNKCFKDFEDWSEFQENNVGNDKDKDGLSDEYEADEACFYKKMGWVVNNEADKEAIKKDFENLNSTNVRNEFVSSIDACSSWNGQFKGRKKRDAEEDSWALSLARERRAALSLARERRAARKEENQKPNKGGNKPNGRRRKNNKLRKDKAKNKKGTKKRERKGRGKGRNNGKNGNRKRKNKDRNGRKGGKGGKDKKTNRNGTGKGKGKGKGNRSKDGDKKKRKKKDNNGLSKVEKKTIAQLLPESVYNQLWCYELSVEKALEKCVEAMILP